MRRASYFPLLAAISVLGCHQAQREFCLSDRDCQPGSRCVEEGDTKACRPQGAGGNGGEGGSGGTGGSGGAGGSGGETAYEAEVELVLEPGKQLAAFLEGKVRRIGKVSLQPTGAGAEAITLHPEEPLALPARLPFALSLPGEHTTLAGEVWVEAHRQDATLATFAVGELAAELTAGESHEVRVELALVPSFDWDGDGDADAVDCAPEDPQRHRRVVEICDGVPQGCSPQCLLPLPEGESVRKLTCASSIRYCAALVEEEEGEPFVRLFPGDAPWLGEELRGIPNLKDIEWAEAEGALALMTTHYLYFARIDGSLYPGSASLGNGRGVAFGTGPFGLFLEGFSRFHLGIVKTRALMEHEHSSPCGDWNGMCVVTLFPANVNEGSGTARGVVVSSGDIVSIYSVFFDRPYLGFLVYDSSIGDRLFERIGPIEVFDGETQPRLIERSGEGVLVIGETAAEDFVAAWIAMADSADEHPPPEPVVLPADACPTDLERRGQESVVRMTDGCTGALLEAPLDGAGKPSEPFVRHPLPGCEKPISLAALPPKEEEQTAVFIACEGEGHIVVRGKH